MRKPTTINTVRRFILSILFRNQTDLHVYIFHFVFAGSSTKDSDAEYKVAQSGDATCNGLESAEVSC